MRSLAGAVLLLLQLTPILGAGVCLHHALHDPASCTMPAQGAARESEQSRPAPSHGCPLMAICAPATPVVPQVTVRLFGITLPSHPGYSTSAALFPDEPITPPRRPPIV